MHRLVFAVLLTAAPAIGAAQQKPVPFEIKHTLGFDRAPALIRHSIEWTAETWTLRNDNGEDVPAYYDKKTRQLLFVDSIPVKGKQYMLVPDQRNLALMPLWIVRATRDKSPLSVGGKRIRRMWFTASNGVIKVSLPKTEQLRTNLEIKSLDTDYAIKMYPVGYAAGSIDDPKHARAIEAAIMAGKRSHPEVFRTYPGIPKLITFADPNPFQKLIKVECHDWARKNNGKSIDLFSFVGYEILLTWNSPVVVIRATRKQKKVYYNHNGVKLNEFAFGGWPIELQTDKMTAPKKLVKGRGTGLFPIDKSLWISDPSGRTIIHQPDFGKLGVYRPTLATGLGRLASMISHSWREGWKPIKQPAKTYADTLTLVCDAGTKKTLAQWLAEIEVP